MSRNHKVDVNVLKPSISFGKAYFGHQQKVTTSSTFV